MQPIEVIDSHTEGEPTRVVLSGWPEPAGRTMVERRDAMRRTQDQLRAAVVREPRGHDAIVGALLTQPDRTEAVTGVVFFNDVGYLGMCGHGLIGVVRTLEHLGRVRPGRVEIDTPVGAVSADLLDSGDVVIRNVPAYLHRGDVSVDVPGIGTVTGDIAWGGNWFFLTELVDPPLDFARRADLLAATTAIRDALVAADITGAGGEMIDHVELYGPPTRTDADSRNFVLCPGTAYDRSPCGTGTSAKLAALHAHGRLALGQKWRQESIVGSLFTGWLERDGDVLVPRIQGRAFVTGRTTLLFDPDDPFVHGIG
ncbi:MAG TPA: proline racemase family protein [Gemmatimonadales bacterium]|jgi:4-hydroxyproline epimerase|nr:proline racemase family protein [Gemmatimonadales bacterium]